MYEQFYHLESDPFRLSPDSKPSFRHDSYNYAKTYMLYSLRKGEGVVLVTGRPGTGKTALLRDFVQSIDHESVLTADMVSTQLQSDDLIRMIAFSFGIEKLIGDESTILAELEQLLIGIRNFGRRVLLIIDEAQNLEPASLKKIERLMALRWKSEPLIQIFLIGREDLHETILANNLPLLRERINAVISLKPLDEKHTLDYIKHRLLQAGWENNPTLDDEIYAPIFNHSHGIPRLVNLICSQLLLNGMTEDNHHIGLSEVNSVLDQMLKDQMLPSPRRQIY
ncbi:ExeA family protein [Sedimenticola selenatireducens]|jgi:type II secretory pathway predicted ATPase ExeA|uniref:AAA family ATPase n=1 Tax=Sedimenticola selenatireducens TaxID=191960 RepID=A0A557SNI5_9GAMM|nr:AAA family ATPase [Sedimenticola selenatireducens]TVO78991.1 AAA family ATPase [Sedimenticola selenatireducens]TVT67217.1 MAG: AAA family ATPase [Sedimenticola selenatireducens]